MLVVCREGGCEDTLGTYGLVAGTWSCLYSLGEVIGPFLGGLLLEQCGFPWAVSSVAGLCVGLSGALAVTSCLEGRYQSPQTSLVAPSDSGIGGNSTCSASSSSWCSNSSSSAATDRERHLSETRPLLEPQDLDRRSYTLEKVSYYTTSRRQDQQVGTTHAVSLISVYRCKWTGAKTANVRYWTICYI